MDDAARRARPAHSSEAGGVDDSEDAGRDGSSIRSDNEAPAAARRPRAASLASKPPPGALRNDDNNNNNENSNNKNTIATSSSADAAFYAPPPQPFLRSSPSLEDLSILDLGAGSDDEDDPYSSSGGGGGFGAAAAKVQPFRRAPARQQQHSQLPPPSPPRPPKGRAAAKSSRRKSTHNSTAPFWTLNRMRSNSTDSVRGAFYQRSDLPSSHYAHPQMPPRRDSSRREELPPSSSSFAPGAAGERRRGSLPKRRRRPSNNKSPLPPEAPGPSASSAPRRFARRDKRLGDGSGSSTSDLEDDGDDDPHYRRMAAAELGRAGIASHKEKKDGRRRSFRNKAPAREDGRSNSIVRYGAASDAARHDEDEKPRNAPIADPHASYQWTISPALPEPPTRPDPPPPSLGPPLRRSIGEEYVPLRPPGSHRSFAPPKGASDGSGIDGSSLSQDEAWSSESEFQHHRPQSPDGRPAPNAASGAFGGIVDRLARFLDPTPWLTWDVLYRPDSGAPYFEPRRWWTGARCVRHLLWNPIQPEFTSLQLFSWAVVTGVVMGFFTAAWKALIEACIHFLWVTVPVRLLQYGIFTSLEGSFPLYHYMWICPAVLGGVLTSAVAALPDKIPDQNDWIRNVHTRGTQDHKAFLSLFVVATAGMASGLSLGPELPLVLAAGMAGSWLGVACKQSVLQARVMNLTAASAAVGGFFGFPMAGALFVLEIPHRMGLQYFEALSPATVSSIVAVLTNRLVVGNDVTGYYSYPFLTTTLPSEIFTSAIVYGFFGAAVGIAYAVGCKKLKTIAHDLFPTSHAASAPTQDSSHVGPTSGEQKPLLIREVDGKARHHVPDSRATGVWLRVCKAIRIASAGCLVGAVVGVIGMFVPHVMFWGEAQLQTLIDKGRTPLPVFGIPGEPNADLVALGRCMIDGSDAAAVRAGFGIQCSFVITFAKVITTGLSLGTGIVGGHFWGPLFVGCSAGHFLTDAGRLLAEKTGYFDSLSRYPCLVILCVMGSAHVVTYRAHMAIMLILTLTISAFDPEDGQTGSVAGDYSAVFPLLVVSVFVSLMLTRSTVFYPTQRSRGDIMAVPEVLCEPGMAGRPMVLDYEGTDAAGDTDEYDTDDDSKKETNILNSLSPLDIEENFEKSLQSPTASPSVLESESPVLLSSSRLDELLNKPLEFRTTNAQSQRTLTAQSQRSLIPPSHRRIRSDPARGDRPASKAHAVSPVITAFDQGSNSSVSQMSEPRSARGPRARSQSGALAASPKTLVRIKAYGEVHDLQPSLLDQARLRAASSADDSHHKSQGFHSRNNSLSSVGTTGSVARVPASVNAGIIPPISSRTLLNANLGSGVAVPPDRSSTSQAGGSSALTLDDFERSFDARLASTFGG